MTYTINKQFTAGKTVYIALTDKDGEFLDFSDYVVKALGSATTPYVAATEKTDPGGVLQSHYVAEITLALINNTGAVSEFYITAYEQAGGSPAPATDTVISPPSMLRIQLGKELPPGIENLTQIKFAIATKTTVGSTVQASVWLERNGQKLDLSAIDAAATCEIDIKIHGSTMIQVQLLTTDFTLNADDIFQTEKSPVTLTGDSLYSAIITIMENGNTWILDDSFYIFP